MKYALIALLLSGCAMQPLNTEGMSYEQKMMLFDRMRLQYRPVQFYPMPVQQQRTTTCYSVGDDMVQCY